MLACSALKAAYRQQLLVSPEVKLVYLRGSMELITARLASRSGHYMNPHLLRSQFDTLEEPANAVIIPADLTPAEIVDKIRDALAL